MPTKIWYRKASRKPAAVRSAPVPKGSRRKALNALTVAKNIETCVEYMSMARWLAAEITRPYRPGRAVFSRKWLTVWVMTSELGISRANAASENCRASVEIWRLINVVETG